MREYFYLVFTFQVQARSSIVSNLTSAAGAHQVLKSMFNALMNKDYSISIDIDSYHSVLEHAVSKVDFSIGTGIYMTPTNLN